jgi:hypothetical protein
MYAWYESERTQHLQKDAPVTRVNRASVYRTSGHEHCRESHTSKIEETPMNRDFQRATMFLLRPIAMSEKKRNYLSPFLSTFKNVNGSSMVVNHDVKNTVQPKFSIS